MKSVPVPGESRIGRAEPGQLASLVPGDGWLIYGIRITSQGVTGTFITAVSGEPTLYGTPEQLKEWRGGILVARPARLE